MQHRENMVEITTRPNEMQAGIVRAVLEDAGIESFTAVAGGVMANAEFGLSFVPTSIYVDSSDAERARAVLQNTREESVDLDWSEVDTGDDSPLSERELEPTRHTRRGWMMYVIWPVAAVVLLILFY